MGVELRSGSRKEVRGELGWECERRFCTEGWRRGKVEECKVGEG